MKYGFSNTIEGHECVVLGFFEDDKIISGLSSQAQQTVDSLSEHLPKKNDCLLQYSPLGFSSKTLILINCGSKEAFDDDAFLKALDVTTKQVMKSETHSVLFDLPQLSSQSLAWQHQQITMHCEKATYQFDGYKSDKKPQALESLMIFSDEGDESALSQGEHIAQGINLARDLGNHPGNVCTPSYLAETGQKLAKSYDKLTTTVLGREQMQDLGMGALLGVAQGSEEEPKLIEMNYRGGPESQAPIVLVGKGITFDSGGISLKPGAGMDEMKYDMCGAASVFGAMKALCLMQLPINVIGLVASAENMPSGRALKPGDIITSLSGQTVEITNTDAEGRLILCDALTYAERYEPKKVLDMATLTGAMVISLGAHYTGFFTEDDLLANDINEASRMSKDKAWRMPLDDCYKNQLESGVADMVNASTSRAAGSITAAYYLSRFTKKYSWAHLDIAGTAWTSGKNNAATGRPVALLSQFLLNEVD